MQIIKDKRNILFLLFVVLIILNFINNPSIAVVQIFSLIFVILIRKKYSSDIRKQLYFTTILFSIISYNMKIKLTDRYDLYFSYISILIYYLNFITVNINNIHIKNLKKFIKDKYTIFFAVFVLYSTLSLFFVQNIEAGISLYITYLIMFSVIVMIYLENKSLNDIKETFSFLKYLYCGVLFLGTLEIFKIRYGVITNYVELGLIGTGKEYFERIPIVFFYNQNNYAVFLVLGIALLFAGIIFTDKKLDKIIYIILFIISEINLIFTTSRICWISLFIIFFIGIAIGILIKKKSIIKASFKYGVLSLIIFIIFSALPFSSKYYGKFNATPFLKMLSIDINNNDNEDKNEVPLKLGGNGSNNERYTLIYDVIKGVIIEKNYLGFGVGNIAEYIRLQDNTFGITNPHSLWFEVLGDFGIPILIYYIYIYLSMSFDSLKIYKNCSNEFKPYIVAISITTLVFVFLAFAPSSVIAYSPFWILMGISGSFVSNILKRNDGVI
ncbi:teichuronic acid biosynthesis protein TuaE [Clostridium sp. USBA 49]|uniref:O-antigen ligase family protein n=1 Tax=Clostridium TaxID=1485 RepID=UPI0009D348D5|nr:MULTISPECIES: O-antigen ligase family protein [Clostridium]SKA88210.1 teichuronic acid biosynthesis protein TuaE [Clostridium sp. USBA 49]